ncbi:hypothetical protein ARALYDRAFT_483800, partial [Arabidopsis lyrata subsp. lyrata]
MSSKPEELCSKIDAFGNVVEESVEAMATNVSTIDECTAAIEKFSFPGDFVQYVINGIHELTGFNWSMSIVLTAFLVSVLMSPVSMRVQIQALELQITTMAKKIPELSTSDSLYIFPLLAGFTFWFSSEV